MSTEAAGLTNAAELLSKIAALREKVDAFDAQQEERFAALAEKIANITLALDSPPEGWHNKDYDQLYDKVIKADSYSDKSCIMAMPSIKPIPPKVAFSWLKLMTPANHRVFRVAVLGANVDDAYNIVVRDVLADATLSTFRYFVTFESDNIAPPDGLLQLLHDIEESGVDGISGIYHTKGPGGVPQCWGRPGDIPKNFRPFLPRPDSITQCNAIGMGFSIYRLDLFRRVSPPWFKTVQKFNSKLSHETVQTQDMYFCDKAAREAGAKFAVSTHVKVGHIDDNGVIW